jgi:hypothetical protein
LVLESVSSAHLGLVDADGDRRDAALLKLRKGDGERVDLGIAVRAPTATIERKQDRTLRVKR